MTIQDYAVKLARKFLEPETIRSRGPRVRVRIHGLAEHLVMFNARKIYTDPQRVAQTASTLSFQPVLETEPPKSFLSRWRGFLTRLQGWNRAD
jgi:hypothetical protein